MAEAEDVIIDAARHTTAYAMALWRRNRVGARAQPAGASLADVRRRLELFIEASLGLALPIRTASVPPPPTLLSRLFDQTRRHALRCAVPSMDGVSIHLPAHLEWTDPPALDVYRVAALQQAARVQRGSAEAYPWNEPLPVQDLFLVAEAATIEADLCLQLPGLEETLHRVRKAMLQQRPAVVDEASPSSCVESVYRRYLETGMIDFDRGPPDVARSLAWARSRAPALSRRARYGGLPADALLGAVRRPDALPSAARSQASPAAHAMRAGRMAPIRRRPRARDASENEDDDQPALWMVQTAQPSEHAEDAMGLQRPEDKEPDADLAGAGDSVSDLEALRLVTTPGIAREAFVSDDAPPPRSATAAAGPGSCIGLAYPEWDYTTGAYRERAAIIRLVDTPPGRAQWVDMVLLRHRATLLRVRRRFESLRSRRCVQHGQVEGEDLDIEAYVGAYGDRRARLPRGDGIYLAYRPARRDFALLLLIDVSGSTEAWCGGTHRIIDVEKEALMIVSAALQALGARFAIQAFSGHGPGQVRIAEVKLFQDAFDRARAQRIAALEPDAFTRLGAALRHATASLVREPAHRRLVLLLSDGKPNDCDRYEGRYGFEDARQALAEARLQGIAPFCVTVDEQASQNLASLFGPGNYSVVNRPEHLASALLQWLRMVTVTVG